MYTYEQLLQQMEQLQLKKNGTLLIHSSMKSIGEVEGGADTVLDVWSQYMSEGLLVLPTHTWSTINNEQPHFSVEDSEVCVGILPELFRKRAGVIRSYHPTHSVAALGEDALSFTQDDHLYDTPCARGSAWGKLLDRQATIMLVGVDLRRNTYIHGVEEWCDIEGRMTDSHQMLYSHLPNGELITVPSRRHCGLSWSEHFWKVDDYLLEKGVMRIGKLGDATVRICDCKSLYELLVQMLEIDPHLFSDNEPMDRKKFEPIK